MEKLKSLVTHPRRRFALLAGLVAVLALGLSACQLGGRATVTLHVTNGGTQATTLAVAPAALTGQALLTPQMPPPATVQSFTPTHLTVPVLQIVLTNLNGGPSTELYHCDPVTDANQCYVDLAKNLKALQDLINKTAQVAAGTYDAVRVVTCTNGQGGGATYNPVDYTADVTGQADIGGKTYVTDPSQPGGVSLATAGNPSPQPVTLGFSGCGRTYPLPQPITLQDGGTFTLSLYIDLADIAWIEASGNPDPQTWFPSGCPRGPNSTPSNPTWPSGPWVCLSYPDVAAAPGDTAPALKRYLVLDGSTPPSGKPSAALFGVYFDAQNHALSGYTRFFYNQYLSTLGFVPGTPLKSVATNSDGTTLDLAAFGSTATGPGYFESTQFPIAGGSGTYSSSNPDTSLCSGTNCPYTATLLP